MKPKAASYAVGYRKPPKEKQFKKGQSGNPKGRPKKVVQTENFGKLVNDELSLVVTISEQGKNVRMTKQSLIVKQVVNRAAKGERWALNAILSLLTFSRADGENGGVLFAIGDPELVIEKYRQERAAQALQKDASRDTLVVKDP